MSRRSKGSKKSGKRKDPYSTSCIFNQTMNQMSQGKDPFPLYKKKKSFAPFRKVYENSKGILAT